MDERCGVWSNIINIAGDLPFELCLSRQWLFTNGDVLVFQHGQRLFCYDSKTNAAKSLGDAEGFFYNGFSYKESLVFVEGMKSVDVAELKIFNLNPLEAKGSTLIE